MLGILVTGSQGFVGRKMVEALDCIPDVQVFALGRRPSTPPGRQTKFIQVDFSGNDDWTLQLPASIDVVIHLAQSTRYNEFPAGAADMVRINVNSTASLLDWSARHGVRRFVLASTGNVYEKSALALDETMPCLPASMYGATKLSAEHLTWSYRDIFPVTIVRLFGVFGHGQSRGLFVNLLNSVRNGTAITLKKGTGLRITPIAVEDVTTAITGLAGDSGKTSSVFNLGGGDLTDVKEIAAIMGELCDRQPLFVAADGERDCLIANSEKLFSHLGWRPKTSLRDGIRAMVEVQSSPAR
jgi:nucleoside-diphosphate-sugar epimerase